MGEPSIPSAAVFFRLSVFAAFQAAFWVLGVPINLALVGRSA
jgi:hypothetical protein